MEPAARTIRLGTVMVDLRARRIASAAGEGVPLNARAFDLLACLVARAGETVGKDVLIAEIWPGRVVEENNLNQAVHALRRALEQAGGEGAYVLTVAGAGYRLVVEPRESLDDDAAAPPSGPPVAAGSGRTRRTLLAAAVATPLVVFAGLYWRRTMQSPAAPRALAVLPFLSLPADRRDHALETGIADTLIARLSAAPSLAVRSTASVLRYAGNAARDSRDAGRELAVETVLDGTLQRDGTRIRVNARLIDVGSGRALWTDTFDAEIADAFELQDAIARRVVVALAAPLPAGDPELPPEALAHYLRGRFHGRLTTRGDLERSAAEFAAAIEMAPRYAPAHAGLAETHRRFPIAADGDPATYVALAERGAARALELDPRLALPHVTLGFLAFHHRWQWELAQREFEQAITLDPEAPEPRMGLAHLHSNLGRHDEALAASRIAQAIDPVTPIFGSLVASFHALAGRHADALSRIDAIVQDHPRYWFAYFVRADLRRELEGPAASLADLSRAVELSGRTAHALARLGWTVALLGNRAEAAAILAELTDRARDRYVPDTAVATVQAGLGENDAALAALTRAIERADARIAFLRIDAYWDGLRGDPRFEALARRVGFEAASSLRVPAS